MGFNEAAQSFIEGDSVHKTEMLCGSVTGGLSKKVARVLPTPSKTKATKSKAAPKDQPAIPEGEVKNKSFTPLYNLRSATKVEKAKSVDAKPASVGPTDVKGATGKGSQAQGQNIARPSYATSLNAQAAIKDKMSCLQRLRSWQLKQKH